MKTTSLKTLAELAVFAREFLAAYPHGAIVGLTGGLGAGKTTFVRALVRELCARAAVAEPRVTSPTFVLHQSYPKIKVDHFDLYRLDEATEESLVHVGYPEALERARGSNGFLFVEWAERARDPQALGLDVTVTMEIIGDTRRITWG